MNCYYKGSLAAVSNVERHFSGHAKDEISQRNINSAANLQGSRLSALSCCISTYT